MINHKVKKNIHPCLRRSRMFGYYHDHDWAYKNEETRICLRCGEEQILFHIGDDAEDWRKKYKKGMKSYNF